VRQVIPKPGVTEGIQLVLYTEENESLPVMLGPIWFIASQEDVINPGDEVQVTGSMTQMKDVPIVLATEVEKDGHILQLRDELGNPYWNAWRRTR